MASSAEAIAEELREDLKWCFPSSPNIGFLEGFNLECFTMMWLLMQAGMASAQVLLVICACSSMPLAFDHWDLLGCLSVF